MRASFEGIVRDPDGRTFAVPEIELDEFHHFHVVERVNAEVERLCGARVTTLRCLSSDRPAEDARHRRYELEAHGPVHGLTEVEVELPAPGNPWEAPGWFDEAAAWIRARVDAPVRQRSAHSISALLRAGDTYFKASPWFFASEPAVTLTLSRRHPGRVPEVLDADVERGWLLMRDFGDAKLSGSQDVESWTQALRAYADLQLAWVGHAGELLAAGCPDRSLPRLDLEIDRALADVDGLDDVEAAAVPALCERLHGAVARVAGFEIPPTLDHGDLHAGNIALREDGPLVFDWSDGCVALPLVSVLPILEWDDPPDGSREVLRAAYLGRLGAPPEAYGDAVLLGFAHQVVSYRHILHGLPPHARWQWESVPAWLVRQLLERVTQA